MVYLRFQAAFPTHTSSLKHLFVQESENHTKMIKSRHSNNHKTQDKP